MTVVTSRDTPWLLRWPGHLMWIAVTLIGSALSALLIARGRWMVVLLLLAAVPMFLVIQRFPLAVMAVWLVAIPFLNRVEDDSVEKLLYWVVHRTLPLATLVVVVLSQITRTGNRRLGRLGWPEIFMLAYLVASVLSIIYGSPANPSEEIRHLYDRVAVPMILYVLVRLLRPKTSALEVLSYILLFILLTQALAGLASWIVPGALPENWLIRQGERTTGSLGHANVFGIVALAAGAIFLHVSQFVDGWRRKVAVVVLAASMAMAILSFSRASWLAALVVLVGLLIAYPRVVAKTMMLGVLSIGILLSVTGGGWIGGYLEERVYSQGSEQSALSRLPVVLASVRMIEAKPLTGWGYGNFNRYDFQFQSRVGDLFVPRNDHSSHNFFLTLGAEQGLIGLGLYVFVAFYWLLRTPRAMARLKSDEMFGRRFLIILWAIIAGHVVVNNFFHMQSPFGFAVWWLSLAMIGNLVTQSTSSVTTTSARIAQ